MLRIKHKEKILQHEHIEVLDCAGIAKPGPTRQLGELVPLCGARVRKYMQ